MAKTTNMSFFSSGAFWGGLVILMGISIILRAVFHIHFPVVRVLFGIFFIYLGARMIFGGWGRHRFSNDTVFDNRTMSYSADKREYNIIFGNGTVDLKGIALNEGRKDLEVNVIFGNGRVLLNDSIPAEVEMNAAFGSVYSPGESANGFGENTYATRSFDPNKPHLRIKANAVFGKITIDKTGASADY